MEVIAGATVQVTAVNMVVMAVGKEEVMAAAVVLAGTVVMGEMKAVISNHQRRGMNTTDMHHRKALHLLSSQGLTATRRRPSHHLRGWIPTAT